MLNLALIINVLPGPLLALQHLQPVHAVGQAAVQIPFFPFIVPQSIFAIGFGLLTKFQKLPVAHGFLFQGCPLDFPFMDKLRQGICILLDIGHSIADSFFFLRQFLVLCLRSSCSPFGKDFFLLQFGKGFFHCRHRLFQIGNQTVLLGQVLRQALQIGT